MKLNFGALVRVLLVYFGFEISEVLKQKNPPTEIMKKKISLFIISAGGFLCFSTFKSNKVRACSLVVSDLHLET